jgi:hypothetical protein
MITPIIMRGGISSCIIKNNTDVAIEVSNKTKMIIFVNVLIDLKSNDAVIER